MYKIFIGLYLLYAVRTNADRLFHIEGGFSAFTKLDWILAVFCVVMLPLAIVMFIAGYREIKEKERQRKEDEKEAEEIERRRKEQKYEDFSSDDDEGIVTDDTEESKYDE
jgi:predicted membrane protein